MQGLELKNGAYISFHKVNNTLQRIRFIFIGISMAFLLFGAPLVATSQIKGKTPEQKQKNARKLKEEQQEEMNENLEMLRKRHRKNQTKETRKRMKRSSRKAKRNRENKRESFWRRIF